MGLVTSIPVMASMGAFTNVFGSPLVVTRTWNSAGPWAQEKLRPSANGLAAFQSSIVTRCKMAPMEAVLRGSLRKGGTAAIAGPARA